jgi:dihydroorotase
MLWVRAQDPWLSGSGVAASGAYASRLGLPGIPVQAETVALNTLFELQRTCGVRLHICRVSSAAGIELVRAAKREGLPVTCDVSANHVHLTDVDIGYYDSNFRLDPPLRGQRDRDAIRAALADGTIDVVCSDHTPVDDDGKMLPFAEAEPGATGPGPLGGSSTRASQQAASSSYSDFWNSRSSAAGSFINSSLLANTASRSAGFRLKPSDGFSLPAVKRG